MTRVANSKRYGAAINRTTSGRCPPLARVSIRVSDASGAYRVIYLARREDAVYVLHAFHKKTRRTPRNDLEIAKRRFGQVLGGKI